MTSTPINGSRKRSTSAASYHSLKRQKTDSPPTFEKVSKELGVFYKGPVGDFSEQDVLALDPKSELNEAEKNMFDNLGNISKGLDISPKAIAQYNQDVRKMNAALKKQKNQPSYNPMANLGPKAAQELRAGLNQLDKQHKTLMAFMSKQWPSDLNNNK